jgi:4-hydroxy 2-oxovalerate aldolase
MQWSVLDCTLRDGGYYTNWDFQKVLVQKYLKTMVDSPVEYVEIGYRNLPHSGYIGEYYYLPNSTLEMLREYSSSKLKLAVMLDAKNYTPQDIPSLLADCQDQVQLVRMAVNPANLEQGIALAKAIKVLGFAVAINLMYLSKMRDEYSFLLAFEKLGEVVDYLYLVDSFGACFPQQVKEAIQFAKNHLPQKIGFHGHDNINLAFANTLAALEAGVDIVDSTVLGMGRGAGNLRTELIIAHLAQSLGKQIDLSSLADLLEVFQKLKDEYRWGSELPYIVSGLADLPQKDVMEWLGKKRYSTSTVVLALQGKQQKELDSEPYPSLSDRIEQLDLQNIKTCVIVGGGLTATEHSNSIIEYVKKQQGLLIHSSLRNAESYTNANIRQILCLPGREAEKLKGLPISDLNQQFLAYVFSSGLRMTPSAPGELTAKTVEVEPITRMNHNSQIPIMEQDPPLGIALGVAQTLGIQNVFLAGFDGYPGGNEVQQELAKEVQEILDSFSTSHPTISVQSLTPTRYQVQQQSVYALLRT